MFSSPGGHAFRPAGFFVIKRIVGLEFDFFIHNVVVSVFFIRESHKGREKDNEKKWQHAAHTEDKK